MSFRNNFGKANTERISHSSFQMYISLFSLCLLGMGVLGFVSLTKKSSFYKSRCQYVVINFHYLVL